jgi:GNAT superfamily N-acetyltransferase
MFTIRRYEPSDHQEACALHEVALRAVNAFVEEASDDDLQHIEDVYLARGGEFLVGVLDGRIVAMGTLRRSSGDRAEIRRMRVHPDYQRRGFGQAILSALERRARELGYTTLHLDTTTVQKAAEHLYTKNGYIEVGRGHAHGFDLVFYEKRLA